MENINTAKLVASAKAVLIDAHRALNHYEPWNLVDGEWVAIWRPLCDSLKELERTTALIDG